MNPIIKVFPSCHKTLDVVLYGISDEVKNWFRMLDIWGSNGYDRFNDGGIYFEIPEVMKGVLPELPFLRNIRIIDSISKEAEFEENRKKQLPAEKNMEWLRGEIQKYTPTQITTAQRDLFIQKEIHRMNQYDLESLLGSLRFRFGSK